MVAPHGSAAGNCQLSALLLSCLLRVARLSTSTALPAVFTECVEGGKISPQTCVYYQSWLDQLEF